MGGAILIGTEDIFPRANGRPWRLQSGPIMRPAADQRPPFDRLMPRVFLSPTTWVAVCVHRVRAVCVKSWCSDRHDPKPALTPPNIAPIIVEIRVSIALTSPHVSHLRFIGSIPYNVVTEFPEILVTSISCGDIPGYQGASHILGWNEISSEPGF